MRSGGSAFQLELGDMEACLGAVLANGGTETRRPAFKSCMNSILQRPMGDTAGRRQARTAWTQPQTNTCSF
ncbi:hypothetical protein AOLI_G00082050 [Acnodon oligacanthus]